VSLIILAGALVLQFLVILSGGINSFPLDTVYFLRATTNGISGARNPSSWTYWAVCGVGENGRNVDCGKPVPALPFDPKHKSNFGGAQGIPEEFLR
jgi:hypothetical protein